MPISQFGLDLKEQLNTLSYWKRQRHPNGKKFLDKEIAKRMGFKSSGSVTHLTQYQEAVDTGEVRIELHELLELQCVKGGPVERNHGVYCAFHKVYTLLGIGRDENEYGEKEVKALNYGPDEQWNALGKVLGKPPDDASVDDLLRVRYSDFKWHLEHP